MILTENMDKFLSLLDAEIDKHLDATQAVAIKIFSRRFFEAVDLVELRSSHIRDIYGGLYGAWHLLQHYDSAAAKVQVLNPSYEEHGWQSPYTVIVVHCRDRAFVIDSLRLELNRRNLTMHTIHSNVFSVKRDKKGGLQELGDSQMAAEKGPSWQVEALIYIAISRHSDPQVMQELNQTLQSILAEVEVVVDDFPQMLALAEGFIEQADERFSPIDAALRKECKTFMQWLVNDHFTFLGVDHFSQKNASIAEQSYAIERQQWGLLKDCQGLEDTGFSSRLDERTDTDEPWQQCISFEKSSMRVRVHRDAYPFYIRVKQYNKEGLLEGECRFLGLFTSTAYTDASIQIPLLRKKLDSIIAHAGDNKDDHDIADFL